MGATDPVNFVILFQGRAGSSYLTDVLDRHPEITAEGEWLAGLLDDEGDDPGTLISRLRALGERLSRGCPSRRQLEGTRAFFGNRRPATRVAGFKTKVRDLRDPLRIGEILEASRARTIVLGRQNVVKQAVSRLNAARLHRRTHRWNRREGEARMEEFTAPLDDFAAVLRHVIYDQRILEAYADLLDLERLDLEYADLLRDRDSWFDAVFDFLGVEPHRIDSAVSKNTDDDLRRVLSNYDELRDAYRGTRFEAMFDETVGSAP